MPLPSHIEQSAQRQMLNLMGIGVQFLVSPEEVQTGSALIRGVFPASAVVPLHSHPEAEILYVVDGTLEVYLAKDGSAAWSLATAGEAVAIPPNVRHAIRNTSGRTAATLAFTGEQLYKMFSELVVPLTSDRASFPPRPEQLQRLFTVAAQYGYWLGSPEENEAIGITL